MTTHRQRKEFVIPGEYCPEAVVKWCSLGVSETRKNSDLATKAKKHLASLGWTFWYAQKKNYSGTKELRDELRYTSPSGRNFLSLQAACKACIDDEAQQRTGITAPAITTTNTVVSHETLIGSYNDAITSIKTPPPYQLVLPEAEAETYLFPGNIMGLNDQQSLRLPESKPEETSTTPKPRGGIFSSYDSDYRMKRKRPVVSATMTTNNDDHDRVRKVVPNRNRKTILFSLIENNVVSVGARVHYRGKSCSGEIFPEGIMCHCCSKIVNLTTFEAHANSTNHRPAANILLDDGRSLHDLQREMKTKNLDQTTTTMVNNITKSVVGDGNDDVCAICHHGGELLLCNRCPSAYHATCLGLKGKPPFGDWFCPPCRCGVCGGGRFDLGSLVCHQCERIYHSGCCERAIGSWESLFCSEKCQRVCLSLGKILGKMIPVGENGLTWTLVKATSPENDQSSKLGVALSVMHESFEPTKDPSTKSDIVEDVIFGRGSELKRLNFRGFYVVVLERNDEMISVALLRIFGEKLAEVPLVATRFRHRRMGMCRILMKELEKQLGDLGVERLTLPAASGVLQTWTSSFGFSVMRDDEKLEILDHSLLDFQDTIMCHKLLKKTSMEKQRPLRRNLTDDFRRECIPYDAGSSSFITSELTELNVEDGITDPTFSNTGGISWSTTYN